MSTDKKYEFTGETREFAGVVLRRIRRLSDGALGGWLQHEGNLDQAGACWVGGDAVVYDGAHVGGHAQVYGDAQVCGSARCRDNAQVCGNAQVYGNARVAGTALVAGGAEVYGEAIAGSAGGGVTAPSDVAVAAARGRVARTPRKRGRTGGSADGA